MCNFFCGSLWSVSNKFGFIRVLSTSTSCTHLPLFDSSQQQHSLAVREYVLLTQCRLGLNSVKICPLTGFLNFIFYHCRRYFGAGHLTEYACMIVAIIAN